MTGLAAKHFAVLLAGLSLAAEGAESAPKKSLPEKSAATKPAQPEIQFLEYLGTVDDEEDNWTDALGNENAAEMSAVKSPDKEVVKGKVEPQKPVAERK